MVYRGTVRKYWENSKKIEPNPHKISSGVGTFERRLIKEMRDRACYVNGIRKGIRPKFDKSVKRDLIRENQWLRMENEYLKKLSA